MTSLESFARVEVKSTLELDGWLWLATPVGLFRWNPGQPGLAEPVPGWAGIEVQALGAAGPDLLVATYDDEAIISRCGADGAVLSRMAPPPGEKVKTLAGSADTVWIGTKRGIFRHDGQQWRHVFGADGKAEMLRVWHRGDGRLAASVKKTGPDMLPALIESTDGGDTWTVQQQPDYQDLVLAADQGTIITRWRGARPHGHKAGYKKHPITAGLVAEDGTWAVVDGDKLEIHRPGAAALSTYHPAFAEAEHVHLVPGGAVVAGAQGAWRFSPATGALSDLLPRPALERRPGKLKRLFLMDGALLATTTFGTFRSFDDGASWVRADSEWWVLDAEHAARDDGGRWWIACQRALFTTADRGGRIDYHKIKVDGPHYAELRALAVAGDRLAIGTKQGLFINRPAEDSQKFVRIEDFGSGPIEAVAWRAADGMLLVGTAAGVLWQWDLVTPPQRIAELPIDEARMVVIGETAWLSTLGRVTEIRGKAISDVTPPGSSGEVHLAQAGDRLLAYDAGGAWLRHANGTRWSPVEGFPAGIRHVAVDAARGLVLATDRDSLFRIAL